MEPPKITIVIPAYNEEKTIGNVINGIISTTPINLNILVINDCSKDNTSQVATSSGATVLNLINNEGYAGAINAGMNHAFKHYNSDYVITMDADGQHPTESVMEVIKLIRNDIDIIVGKRPYYGRFSEYIFSIYFKFKYNIKDPLCGLKAYSKRLYCINNTFETYDSIGTQLIILAHQNNLVMKQIDIKLNDRIDEPRFGNSYKANLRILKSLIKTIRYSK